ncbi:alginate lyase family protein [Nibrella saemangeumensis]|uniref:Alginate lyase family protein n=1 Tax=Nibrella saemangeumensis TaxID=1084526 RepID=A0ABP8N3Z2_9BACT
MSRTSLIWHTVRHLKPRQILYQVLNRLRQKPRLRLHAKVPPGTPLTNQPATNELVANQPPTWQGQTVTLLNQAVTFADGIDWNYAANGKLWTYNLNYFDFLNQSGLPPEQGLALIRDFIRQTDTLTDGLEPYPTSLRILNWVHFLLRHTIQDETIDRHLYAQVKLLRSRLEYHLGANHLLENGFALLTSAVYFRQRVWLRQAASLLVRELAEQILPDGGHYERSPMYHQILLDRLLDAYQLLNTDTWHATPELSLLLAGTAARMLGWLDAITFANGDIPYLNDAAPGIAPTTQQLRHKAGRVGVQPVPVTLRESGYRKLRAGAMELVANVGSVGPAYQPGHAHADTFSLVLYVNNQPIVVDLGTSTYQIDERRSLERSTAAHNTVEVAGQNSSEVWGGFRVARRASVTRLVETGTSLSAQHDGYRRLGLLHERTWQVEPGKLIITDRLLRTGRDGVEAAGVARLYFHPAVVVTAYEDYFQAGPLSVTFEGGKIGKGIVQPYEMADGFNRRRPAQCLLVSFRETLITTITVT